MKPKKLTLVKRRNAEAERLRNDPKYRNTAPLQGTLTRHSRCPQCGGWQLTAAYASVPCLSCRSLL